MGERHFGWLAARAAFTGEFAARANLAGFEIIKIPPDCNLVLCYHCNSVSLVALNSDQFVLVLNEARLKRYEQHLRTRSRPNI